MFYIVSKLTGGLLTSPVCYIIVLLLLAVRFRSRKRRIASIVLAFAVFFLGTDRALYNAAIASWSAPYLHAYEPGKTYRYGIILGGFASYDRVLNRIEFNQAADRWIDGVLLYKQGKIEKIVIASDGSVTSYREQGNPALMIEYLKDLGVEPRDIIRRALNTRQNALFTLPLLEKTVKADDCLLITSAAHMRRALATFEKEGFAPVPYVTDIQLTPVTGW
ncbi:MAG: YdcF family protein [Parabacteroides sp.]|nr:YdcF family protein [Parabacteroides sp.]